MSADLLDWTLVQAASAVANKEVSSEELTEVSLEAAQRWNPAINAFLTINAEQALLAARSADSLLSKGEFCGPLHGVPLAHKDLFYHEGEPLTCGSEILKGYVPSYDATVIQRLHRQGGAVDIGRLNMAEIAMGAAGRNEHFGHCRNPWNTARITGGSSSGSGAAVAARNVYGALGTDTGGSIRIPSTVCGRVGLKGTYGRVSRYGVMPLSYSLDHPGPMVRTVRDCARMFAVIAGYDPMDPSTSREPVPDYESLLDRFDAKGLRIGVPRSYFYDEVDPSVNSAVESSLKVFRELGATIVEVDVPDQLVLRDMTNLVLKAEVANIHSQWLQRRGASYSAEVRARIESGLYIPAVDYLRALRLRGTHARSFVKIVFDNCDVLHTPTLPIETPMIAEIDSAVDKDALWINEKLAWCTRTINYLGLPALTIPCGFSDNNLPVGFQLVGRPFSEDLLLQAGHAYQRHTDWHIQSPTLSDDLAM